MTGKGPPGQMVTSSSLASSAVAVLTPCHMPSTALSCQAGEPHGMSSTSWKKLESTSRPGHFYYYNTKSRESRWSEPPRNEVAVHCIYMSCKHANDYRVGAKVLCVWRRRWSVSVGEEMKRWKWTWI